MIQNSGSQAIVSGTDAAIGTSGKPTRVFAVNFLSGGTAGVLILRNGTTASGTVFITENGVISSGKTATYGTSGVLFPAGCFMDVDANVTGGVVSYAQEGS
jgi:hypothetical protein